MKLYSVSGRFLMGPRQTTFTKQVASETQNDAIEYVYSILGSKHRVRRRNITIQRIEEIPASEVTDPSAKFKLDHSEPKGS